MSAKTWELESARLRLLGTTVHTGVLAYVFSVSFHSHQVPTAHQLVVTLVNNFSLGSDEIIANPMEVLRRQNHTGREVWRLDPLAHPKGYREARSVLRGGNGERFVGFCGKSRRAHQRVGTSSSHQ